MSDDPLADQSRWPLGDLISAGLLLVGLVLLGTCFILT